MLMRLTWPAVLCHLDLFIVSDQICEAERDEDHALNLKGKIILVRFPIPTPGTPDAKKRVKSRLGRIRISM